MKKKFVITVMIVIAIAAAISYLSQPKSIINNIDRYHISQVVYNGVDVTEQVDCKTLASIVSNYKCGRLPHRVAPYQESQVVVELNGIDGKNILHIILGDINFVYENANKGFSIKNSDALFREILNTMPDLTDEEQGLEKKNVITFSDGKSADLWRTVYGGSNIYKLSDGTTLLTIEDPAGPDNVYIAGRAESFDDLSESAQQAVSAFFEEQGLLYDTQAELENAYAEYLTCIGSGTEYHDRYITQIITPTASNDHMMYFLTSVTLPVNGQTSQEIRLGTAFDRKTGKALSNWDLFTLPEAEARQWLLDAFHVDSALRTEMEAALKPENMILFPENLEVTFPQGSLPSQKYRYDISLTYHELKAVLQPWVIPDD